MKKKIWIFIAIVLLIGVVDIAVFKFVVAKNSRVDQTTQTNLEAYKEADLKKYDGSTEGEKILIGLNGLVYDVTSGSEFYKKGEVYNYLAGKDSSTELNLIGGSIIKRKYPVVGRLLNEK